MIDLMQERMISKVGNKSKFCAFERSWLNYLRGNFLHAIGKLLFTQTKKIVFVYISRSNINNGNHKTLCPNIEVDYM